MPHHIYNIDNLLTILQNPTRLVGVYHMYASEINKKYYKLRKRGGVDIMAEDWDTLILLDGCRYDIFADQSTLTGNLEKRRSRGSDSQEFITANFTGRELHDTVYVTSNPYVAAVDEGVFYAIENVLESEWDEDLRTVPPEAMSAAIEEAHARYPNKRIIGHFMQPHFPFIGPTGQEILHGGIHDRDVHRYHEEVIVENKDEEELSIWSKLQFKLDNVTKEQVWQAYRENLDLVLEEVDDLISRVDGKKVISADHGNLVGDWIGPFPCRGYGHPRYLHVDPLVTVPWLVIESENRRNIVEDDPLDITEMDDEILEDRLSALGYK